MKLLEIVRLGGGSTALYQLIKENENGGWIGRNVFGGTQHIYTHMFGLCEASPEDLETWNRITREETERKDRHAKGIYDAGFTGGGE